jgi:hypothetical protein
LSDAVGDELDAIQVPESVLKPEDEGQFRPRLLIDRQIAAQTRPSADM